ncbi:MAG: HEPN domain-containing protein, partial [Elusimicrobiales bacterium]
EIVLNWIKKAENDLKTAKDEMAVHNPATDTICFHAKQCVEKYLKAYLVFHQKYFRKTHNIAELIELCKEIDQDFNKLYDLKVENLTPYATEIRYPEDFYFPSEDEAKEAIEIAEKVRSFVIEKLKQEGLEI